MTREVVSKERSQRAAMAAGINLAFAVVMVSITRRIERLTTSISGFSKEVCYEPIEESVQGDQLAVLETRFHCLKRGIMTASASSSAGTGAKHHGARRERDTPARVVSRNLGRPLLTPGAGIEKMCQS